jgi:CRP-like cAMP-binding protein
MREGEPGDALFVVHAGRLRAAQGGAALGELGPGDGFGELALVDGGPRTATVEAIEDTQLLRLPRDAFLAVLAARPELGLGLLQALARWLRGVRAT